MYVIIKKRTKCTWDPNKNRTNISKHDISFEEACSIFDDDYMMIINDPDHSTYEERFVAIGLSNKLRLLVVCHCYRNEEERIRIISARKATKKEKEFYSYEKSER